MSKSLVSYLGGTSAVTGMATAILLACSSSDEGTSPFSPDATSDAPPGPDAPPAGDDARADALRVCSPSPLATPPTWHPPKPFNPTACSAAQLDGFLQSCLASSQAVCDAFRQQNPGCAACAYTSSTDPQWGPVVSYRDTDFAELNDGGCAALSLGETDETGCGGAFELYRECAVQACSGCLPLTNGDPKPLEACQNDPAIKNICAGPLAQGDIQCVPARTANAKRCEFGPTFDESVVSYLTFWCSTPADAGNADSGDAHAD